MIKEENDSLRFVLDQRENELREIQREHRRCRDDERELEQLRYQLKSTSSQLEKEKSKTKALMNKVKELQNEQAGSDNVMWFGISNPPTNIPASGPGERLLSRSKIPPVSLSRPSTSMSIGLDGGGGDDDDDRIRTSANLIKKNRLLQSQIRKLRIDVAQLKEVL